jgi:putative PEP-CTERM system histidine kinase
MNAYSIIKLLSLIIHIFLGGYAIQKSPRNRLNQSFSLVAFSVAVMEFGYFMFLIIPDGTVWIRIALFGQCLTAVNIVLFTMIYGRENYKDSLKSGRFYLIAVYFVFLILAITILSGILNFERLATSPDYRFILTKSGFVFIIFLLICDLIALVNLENIYRQVNQRRRSIQYPAIIYIGMLSFHLLVYSLTLGFFFMQMSIIGVTSITLIIANSFIAYPVIKSKLEPKGIYVGRVIIAKSYTLLLAGLYLLIVGLLGKIIQIIGENLNFFLALIISFFVLLVLMAILVSRSLKRRFQTFIERNFYSHKYDYRKEWENFSQKVFSILSMKELLQEILNTVSGIIGADRSSILLLDERKAEFFVAVDKTGEQEVRDIIIPANNTFLDWLWRYGSPIRIENGKCKTCKSFSDSPDVPNSILNTVSTETEYGKQVDESIFCVPIIAENMLIAIIILGCMKDHENQGNDKNTKVKYSQEDMDILETMANQISIAIMNVKKSQELAVSRELESFYKLSSMLLHDLKNSASMLSLVVQNATDNFDNPEFQKDALNTLSNAVSKIQKIISKLSSTPRKEEFQHIQLVELLEIVNKAISSSGIRNMGRIKIIQELNPIPKLMLDSENIERVISNLILNAIESIENEGTITVKTSQNQDGFIQISISDTGCGMSQEFIRERLFKPFQTTKIKGIGIGLYQCKAIVDAYGGIIDVQSQHGIGSVFTIKLPFVS